MDANMFSQLSDIIEMNHYERMFKLQVTNDYADCAVSNQHLVQLMETTPTQLLLGVGETMRDFGQKFKDGRAHWLEF